MTERAATVESLRFRTAARVPPGRPRGVDDRRDVHAAMTQHVARFVSRCRTPLPHNPEHGRHAGRVHCGIFRELFVPAHYFSKTWRCRRQLKFTVFTSIKLVNESLNDQITELIQSVSINHKMFQGTFTA